MFDPRCAHFDASARVASGQRADISRMHWTYYLLIAAAVIVLLNIVLVVCLAFLTRDANPSRR